MSIQSDSFHTFLGALQHLLTVALVFLLLLLSVPAMAAQPVIGYLEKIRVTDKKLGMKAKIDTGADQSSIHAQSPLRYKKHGTDWVKFKIIDERGQYHDVDKKVIRVVYIKRKNLPSEKRLVVKMTICLGGVKQQVEVNLANRSNFRYPMLVGRNFLKHHFLIDPSKQFTFQTTCRE